QRTGSHSHSHSYAPCHATAPTKQKPQNAKADTPTRRASEAALLNLGWRYLKKENSGVEGTHRGAPASPRSTGRRNPGRASEGSDTTHHRQRARRRVRVRRIFGRGGITPGPNGSRSLSRRSSPRPS
uniref:Uncharacterized protein n=1 Tax=Aegilops tauschii subsp. strangulata TaxID=200361 RepID=A0A453IKU8_AEGTS